MILITACLFKTTRGQLTLLKAIRIGLKNSCEAFCTVAALLCNRIIVFLRFFSTTVFVASADGGTATAAGYFNTKLCCAAIGYTLNVQRIPEGIERKPSIEAAVPDGHDPNRVTAPEPEASKAPPPASRSSPGRGGSGALRGRFARHGSRLNG